jgi:hypothetical protein
MNKYILFVFVGLISCGKEDVRMDFLKKDSQAIQFQLEKGDVVNIYSEIDIQFNERPLFVYDFKFYCGDSLMYEGGTDPFETENNTLDTLLVENGISYLKLYGKLNGNMTAGKAALYTIKTTFIQSSNVDLKINKADIVFVR